MARFPAAGKYLLGISCGVGDGEAARQAAGVREREAGGDGARGFTGGVIGRAAARRPSGDRGRPGSVGGTGGGRPGKRERPPRASEGRRERAAKEWGTVVPQNPRTAMHRDHRRDGPPEPVDARGYVGGIGGSAGNQERPWTGSGGPARGGRPGGRCAGARGGGRVPFAC
jgi:hypothetical protein